ncbi:Vacuolar membrane-associated protein iml15 / FY16936)) [Taphrina deformans PYCC 5710]|uniref:Vacuolar membrane-associated protein IML1 n=1 Tax=Taphrina deformans (strain PYCC 5710 / ATCC 11124 / CBS 356.35 / IMI 108563 / JCM 9778 / NBRC 8474) TaxID=1097556 RepID=R4X7R0_TAPDE|nr:Vacuolar membrane-associated protein iml15 / FY16936)) [Taphrina deformans PYCC 5710]|eukprot:CCG81213.1 Vacuolar membrane-associated protein iml15 / FY16936)) [Taphrina deformans PYCC 5710]
MTADALGRELILWMHETTTSTADAILNHDLIPDFDHANCVLEISTKVVCGSNSPRLVARNSTTSCRPLVVSPSELGSEVRKKTPNLQISLLSHLATTFGINPRSVVTVEAVPKSAHVADFMVLYFKDQYISRSDMWRAACNLEGQCIYVGKRITFTGGIRADVREIWRDGQKSFSAYVSANTKPVFRSESARYLIFIQMSKEMWDFEEDGELFYNKAIDGFLPELFKKWKSMNAHHLVSIVLFTRVSYQGAVGPFCLLRQPTQPEQSDVDFTNTHEHLGKAFHNDFYKIVVDNVSSNHWESTLTELKRELHGFARDVLLQKRKFRSDEHAEAPFGSITTAMEGNILEAINLAAHQFNRDHIDRDLLRTGTSMLFVTAGTGVFEVDERLLKLTGESLLGNGIGMDIVCLSRRPLHVVPLFRYAKEQEGEVEKNFQYVLPYICEISYYGEAVDTHNADGTFQPRLKMHDLQMKGRRAHPISAITIDRLNDHIVFEGRELAQLTTGLDTRLDLYDELCFCNKDNSTKITNTIQKDKMTSEVPGEEIIQLLGTSLPSSGEKITFKSLYELSKANTSPVDEMEFPPSKDSRTSNMSAILSTSQESGRYTSVSSVEHRGQSPTKSRSTFSRFMNRLADKADSIQAISEHNFPNDESQIENTHAHLPPLLMTLKSLKAKPSIASMSEEINISSTLIQPRRAGRQPSTFRHDSMQLNDTVKDSEGQEQSRTVAIPIHSLDVQSQSSTAPKSSRKILTSIDLQEARAQSVSQTLRGHSELGSRSEPRSRSNLQIKYKPEKSEAPDASPWHILANPSYPSKNSSTMNAKAWRWAHVSDRARRTGDMNWESMCAPAALPLTTTTIIDLEELKSTKYSENSYSIWIDLVDQPLTQTELLREMIGQRLVQGYQIARTPEISHTRTLTAEDLHSRLGTRRSLVRGPLGDMGETIYLSHAQMEVHCITCDLSREMIEVTRYVRTRETPKPIGYSSLIWQLAQDDGYDDSVVVFRPQPTDHSWNYVDQIICGVERRFTDSVRFWRARFLLIPSESRDKRNPPPIAGGSEQFTEEEVKVAGVNKICELLEKSIYLTPREHDSRNKISVKKVSSVAVAFTTLSPAAYVAHEYEHFSVKPEEHNKNSENKSKSFISTELSLDDYAKEMQSNKGITIKDRLWHWRWHESSWVGSELVSWLLERTELQTREAAARTAQNLMVRGLFEHVQNKHGFLDGFYLYRLKPEFVLKSAKTWFGSRKVTPVAPPPLRARAISNVSSSTPQSPISRPLKAKFELSHWMRVDIDPHRKSHRPEFVSLHYDNVHNPETCFHLRLEWIAVTAKLVEEMVQQWARIGEKYGLTLVEAPVDEAVAVTASNPFRAPLVIELCLNTPPPKPDNDGVVASRAEERERWFSKILRYWNFVLDQEAASKFPSDLDVSYSWGRPSFRYTQYIHRSGMSLCQITPTGFLWLTNRLFVSRVTGAAPMTSLPSPVRINSTMSASEPDNIRNAFRQWCHDPEKLQNFFDQGLDSEQTLHVSDHRASIRARPKRKSSGDDRSSITSIAPSQ